jgi:hypothetical protein
VAKATVQNMMIQWVASIDPDRVQGVDTDQNAGFSVAVFPTGHAGSTEWRAFLFWTIPFGDYAGVTSALMKLYSGINSGGNKTVSVQRVLAPWNPATLTWNNKPAVGPVVASVTKTADAAGLDVWSFDVKTLMVDTAAGVPWYGVCVSISDGDSVWWFGDANGYQYGPSTEIEWVGGISAPDQLNPNGSIDDDKPILSYNHLVGDSDVNAAQWQVDDNPDFTSPWDSGWVAVTADNLMKPRLNLEDTDFPGIAENATVYWRVRQRNIADQISDWSIVAPLTNEQLGTVAITQPAGDTLGDPSPVVSWTYTGGDSPQGSFQVLVRMKDSQQIVYDSGRRAGTATDFGITSALPSGQTGASDIKQIMIGPDKYPIYEPPPSPTDALPGPAADHLWLTLEIRVFDTGFHSYNEKTSNDGSGIYAVATKDFYIDLDNGLDPVYNLNVDNINPWGWGRIEWDRDEIPDEYAIFVGGQLWIILPGTQTHTTGTHNEYMLYNLPPRVAQRIYVLPRVNGVVSLGADDPSYVFTPSMTAPLLCEMDGSNAIFLLNYELNEEEFDNHSVFDTLGSGPPILVSQGNKGKRGTMAGELTGDVIPGVDAKEEARRFRALKSGPGRALMFRVLDSAMTVYIADPEISVRADNEGLRYDCSFSYYQLG